MILPDVPLSTSSLLDQPSCRVIQPGHRHWSIFSGLCSTGKLHGPVIQDAWLAAIAIEHGCLWTTNDRGFAKYKGLRWQTVELV